MVFNEITKRAIEEAFEHPGDVDAQEGRRPAGAPHPRPPRRLQGEPASSGTRCAAASRAGRVQSVALQLICDREREIRAFVPEEYWTVARPPRGRRSRPPSRPTWSRGTARTIEIGNADEAGAGPRGPRGRGLPRRQKVQARERRRNPVPALHHLASSSRRPSRKLALPRASKTMQVAQRLYEGVELGDDGSVGLITYMRTDSTRVSDDALAAVRGHIAPDLRRGLPPREAELLQERRRTPRTRTRRSARPTSTTTPSRSSATCPRTSYALYKLIWNRFVASQMRPAVYDETVVDIEAGAAYLLRAKGSILKFKGFLAVYEETPDEKRRGEAHGRKPAPAGRTTRPPRTRRDPAAAPRRGRRPHAQEARHRPALHPAAAPLHRGEPGEGAGGERHRPALHLRVDHLHHRGPRVHGEARGQALSRPSSASWSPTCWSSTSRTS